MNHKTIATTMSSSQRSGMSLQPHKGERNDFNHLQYIKGSNSILQEVENLRHFVDDFTFSPLLRKTPFPENHRYHQHQYDSDHPSLHFLQSKEYQEHQLITPRGDHDSNHTRVNNNRAYNADENIVLEKSKVNAALRESDPAAAMDTNMKALHNSIVISSSSASQSSASSSSSSSSTHQNETQVVRDNSFVGSSHPDDDYSPVPNIRSPPPLSTEKEREKLRAWVTQVRLAVQEWVQEYRHYITTLQQAQQQAAHVQAAAASNHRDNDTSLRQHTTLKEYEDTIVSLNDVIREQRQRIHELEKNQVDTARAGTEQSVSFTKRDDRPCQERINPVHDNNKDDATGQERESEPDLQLPQHAFPSQQQPKQPGTPPLVSTTGTITTTKSNIIEKTNHCKRIVHSNGTVQEIYYKNNVNDPQHTKKKRWYDIVRFYNGDVKMRTTACTNDHHKEDGKNDDTSVQQEIYYYYYTSGIIQITRQSHPTATTLRRTQQVIFPSLKDGNAMIEYHYPNGQIEYHYQNGSKVVVQFPDGTMTTAMMTTTRT
jgi:hypothetical protein